VAKDFLFNRMHLVEGAGAMHFHTVLPADWFEQLVVEQPRVRYTKGRAVREWIKPNGARNEALDLSVYNLAMAYQLGLHKWAALDWQRLRDKLVPAQLTRDLFAPAPAIVVPTGPAKSDVPRETEPASAVHTYGQPENPVPAAPPAIRPPAQPAPAHGRRFMSRGIR
jgi:phage terminase large subunit GpA-like protein